MSINLEKPTEGRDKIRLPGIIVTFLFLWTLSVVFNVAWGSGWIENISLKKEGNFTQVTIYADKSFEFSHSTEEAKNGKPYRLIIDCKDVVFGLPQHSFKEGLPSGIIAAIRTGQFQVVPEKIVRVVLDLKGPVVYKVTEMGSEKRATLAILTTPEPDFPTWMAVKETNVEEKNNPAKEGNKQTSITSIETTPPSEPEAEESSALLTTTENSSVIASPEKTETFTVQKERAFRKAVSYADTGETPQPKKDKQVLLSQSSSEDKATKENINKEEITSPTIQQKSVIPESKSSTEVFSRQSTDQTGTASVELEVKSTKNAEVEKDVALPQALVSNPSSQAKLESSKIPSVVSSTPKDSLIEQVSIQRQISRSPVPLGPFPEEKAHVTETTTDKTKMTGTETENKKNVTTDAGMTVQKGISKILGTEGVSAHESDSLLEGSALIQNPQQLGVVPSRKLITYNPETSRDPFLPLTDKESMAFGEPPLPRIENLKLVGIIRDKLGNQVLLEDEIGYGYILRNGDKIKNGYVLSVEDEKVVFQVEEYGGYKTITLELNPEN